MYNVVHVGDSYHEVTEEEEDISSLKLDDTSVEDQEKTRDNNEDKNSDDVARVKEEDEKENGNSETTSEDEIEIIRTTPTKSFYI